MYIRFQNWCILKEKNVHNMLSTKIKQLNDSLIINWDPNLRFDRQSAYENVQWWWRGAKNIQCVEKCILFKTDYFYYTIDGS